MLLQGLTRRFRGGSVVARGSAELLVGNHERGIVACPSCGRPVATFEGRCPGCGTWLLAGVRMRTAAFLILVGCAVGMIGGAIVAGTVMAPRLAAGDAARAALAAAPATPEAVPSAAPALGITAFGPPAPAASAPPSVPELPAGMAGSLLQVLAVNDRLASSGESLKAVLAQRKPSAPDVAGLMRRIVADARYGTDAAGRLGGWAPSAPLGIDAAALYTALVTKASDGLAAPLGDRAAYVAAGRTVVAALGGLPELAVTTRDVAGLAGIAVPALDQP